MSNEVNEKVLLKVSPWKRIIHFGLKWKLSLRFIRPYKILERIRPVAYCLALPPKLSKIHDVFHVEMLRTYLSTPDHVIQLEILEVKPNMSYEE